jgi:AcrR family transcriptional regulator
MPRINAKYHEDAKKKIIAAALDVAAENGWDAVTLDAIAQNIGVSKPALYSYFENREALLREVVLEVVQNVRAGLETILVQDEDVHLLVRNLAELLFERQKPCANIFFLLPTKRPSDPEYREEFIHIFNTCRILIRDCLARVKDKGKVSRKVDPDTATYMIIAMSMGLLTSSDFMEMDTDAAKQIWIDAVERLLLIGHGAGGRK